ncbi:uncharacterized protein [Nicotiana sylvestris]|uniref:uncharacterized protein n=1 Tax=Nicotiana sylvestris TaxID=4096 RepID=UPI00388C65E5
MGLRELILEKANGLRYSIHPSVVKMYHHLKQHYWWRRIKKYIIGYVSQCLNCQQVKYEHQILSGLLQKIDIPEGKWKHINMGLCGAFMKGENVLLQVSPIKVVLRFGKKEKWSPRYLGPSELFEGVGKVAYIISLSPSSLGVHLRCHVYMFQKHHEDLSHALDFSSVPLDKDLTYDAELVAIFDKKVQKLRLKNIAVLKARWRGQAVKEAILKTKHDMSSIYPHLFA